MATIEPYSVRNGANVPELTKQRNQKDGSSRYNPKPGLIFRNPLFTGEPDFQFRERRPGGIICQVDSFARLQTDCARSARR